MRHLLTKAAFVATLSLALYFALLPNDHRNLLNILPAPIRSWCGLNDDLSNFLFFSALGVLAFHVRLWRISNLGRLIALLSLAAAFEVAQLWIPGRFSTLRDVWMGSMGILCAWVFSLVADLARTSAKSSDLGDLS